MSYAEILVQGGLDATAAKRLQIAQNLAARYDAQLVGVFLTPSTRLFAGFPGADGAAASPQIVQLLEEQRAEVAARARKARSAFEQVAGSGAAWRELEGWSPEPMTLAARTSDLVVMAGPPENLRDGLHVPADAVAMASGAPVIAVPDTAGVTEVGRRVLVAWNGSREAARAFRDALPILRMADAVTALIVDHPPQTHEAERYLQAWFDRQGCKGSVQRLPTGGDPAQEVILRHAGRIDADLIVMGLYGHSRLREFILGGVSREMLEHSPLPLFLSH
jgi:nucleotide-binding universal stress UspA family protein